MPSAQEKEEFIRRNLAPTLLPDLGLTLYMAHPGSGLSRLGARPPYWAYCWAGGRVVAQEMLGRDLRGTRVLDFGAGSGLVGLVAARAGAEVVAVERDPWARVALGLNATLNGLSLPLAKGRPKVDLVLAGDVFYDAKVADTVLPVLDRFLERGADVLVGDPGRAHLPLERLVPVAQHAVQDMGDAPHIRRPATVYRMTPRPAPPPAM